MLPELMKALYMDTDKMITDYKKQSEIFMEVVRQLDTNRTIDKNVDDVMLNFEVFMGKLAPIFAGMLSQQTIKKLFLKDNIDAEVISLNMDLDGNPTSEMGSLLFQMACSSEFNEVESREDFVLKVDQHEFSKSFQKQLDKFIRLYGARGFKEIDVATVRCYEDMVIVYDKLSKINTEDNQNLTVKLKREEAYVKLHDIASQKGKHNKFEKAASRLKATFGYREYPKYMLVNAFAKLHKICLDIGEDWVFDGRLEEPYQIFDLKISDISMGQTNMNYDLKSARVNNLSGYKKVEHITEWPLVIDSRGKIHQPILEVKDGDIIGDAIAPGKIIGRAKVLHSPYEKTLEAGEILITRTTEPSWTPIFTNAAGVVMEIGGPLQHGGIIAREYGIPCVSGLVGIMDLIKDGDLIEVDGNQGKVKIIENAK